MVIHWGCFISVSFGFIADSFTFKWFTTIFALITPVFFRILHFCLFSFLSLFISSCFCLLKFFFTLCVVTASALDVRENFLLSGSFYLTHVLLLSMLPLGWQFNLEGCRTFHWGSHWPGPSVCLNHTVFDNYMRSSELYLNFSKYFDKLLVGKSLINFKHFS